MDTAEKIAIGVAGWSYPDWEGYVYTGRVGDKLRFLAGYVDMIEINSTFYRPPDARNADSWVQRTQDCAGFFFTAKLHQEVTHQRRVTPEMVRQFHEGLRPMTEAGKLRYLLAQFRYDFVDCEASRAHLQRIRENFGDIANLTLELRHNSWQIPATLDYLSSLGVTVTNLDYPTTQNSFNLRTCGVGEHAYLRLHGRNAAAWFDKTAGRDARYDYRYSKAEMEGIKARALDLAKASSSLTVVANNHYQGKAVVNALQLKAMISGDPVPVPPGLLATYPELADVGLPPPQTLPNLSRFPIHS